MATLYVENVPDELYEALRARARSHRNSIAGEVIDLLQRFVPTESDLKRPREFYKQVLKFQSQNAVSAAPRQSVDEMLREDRER
jgi:hypothetical protein